MDINDVIYLCYQVVNEYLCNIELKPYSDPWFETLIINFLHENININYKIFLRSFSQEFDKILYKKIGSDVKQYIIDKETKIKTANLVRKIFIVMRQMDLDNKINLTCA